MRTLSIRRIVMLSLLGVVRLLGFPDGFIHRLVVGHYLKVSDFRQVRSPMVQIHEVLKPALPELIRLPSRHPLLLIRHHGRMDEPELRESREIGPDGSKVVASERTSGVDQD
jgi:hypothetical protein